MGSFWSDNIVATMAAILWIGCTSAHAESLIRVAPGPDVQDRLQGALLDVDAGGIVQLASGTFELTDGLSLDIAGVTLRGAGKYRTILSFKGQRAGSEGLLVTADNVTLEEFAIEDAKGDAFKVKDVDGIYMINLRAEWTGGPNPDNGAYGFYPVGSKNVLIDGCIAIGASDAGIYVGQSEDIIIRNSTARDNVAGFEVENSFRADLYNNVATNNTGGFLIFDLPNLPQQGGHHVRLFDNISVNNNTPNFAPEGNIVANVPTGLGIMIMANRDIEVFNNIVDGNQSVAILINSYLEEFDDENYQPHPKAIHVHHNRIGRNGWDPQGDIGLLVASLSGVPVPAIVFDGLLPIAYGQKLVPPEDWVYVNDNIVVEGSFEFVNLNFKSRVNAGAMGVENYEHTVFRDVAAHAGGLPPLPAVVLRR